MKDEKAPVDCGDSGCINAHPRGGMRTNGGCKCFVATHDYQTSKEMALRAKKSVAYWRRRAERDAERLAQVEAALKLPQGKEALNELQRCTGRAIEVALAQKNALQRHRESINWADLRCVHAEFVVEQNGSTFYRVWIEEASPGCPEFHQFICTELQKAGFFNVEVRTDW